MKRPYRLAQRVQFLERLVPARWRVPLRFHVQQALGGLEAETRLLPELVPRDTLAVDVGANHGTYTILLSRLCKHVVAFEPLPTCASVLRAWARGRNVTVHESALTEGTGLVTLHVPRMAGRPILTRASLIHPANPYEAVEVTATPLDAFALEHVGFVKIDVEGTELSMLRGGAATISRWRPNVLIEIAPQLSDPATRHQVFAWFAARNYTSHVLRGAALVACDSRIWDSDPDVYNFVFMPKRGTAAATRP